MALARYRSFSLPKTEPVNEVSNSLNEYDPFFYDSILASIEGLNQTGKTVLAKHYPTTKSNVVWIDSMEKVPSMPLEDSVQKDTLYILDDCDQKILKKRSWNTALGRNLLERIQGMVAMAFHYRIDIIFTIKPSELNTVIKNSVDYEITTIPRRDYFKYMIFDKRLQRLRRLYINKYELFAMKKDISNQLQILVPKF